MIPITCMSNCLIRAAVYTTQKDKQFLSEGGDSSHNLVISPWTTGCYGWVSYSGCLQCMPPRKLMSFLFIFSISQIAIEKKKKKSTKWMLFFISVQCMCLQRMLHGKLIYIIFIFKFLIRNDFTSVYCIYVQSITIVGKLC